MATDDAGRSGRRRHPPVEPSAARTDRWLREHIIQIVAVCAFVYMLLPNVVVVMFSFNRPSGRFNYSGRSSRWTPGRNPCGGAGHVRVARR